VATGQDELMDLDAVADELYGLSQDEFISTRAEREKQAKGADNPELAAAIHRLPKPNAVGWLVNQLARHRNADIQTLLELGAGMREATANLSGDLRQLSRQQHQVVRGLVQHGEQLAKTAGRPVSADTARRLQETFYAALADSGAADSVAAGRLAVGLSSTGFAGLEGIGGQPRPSATKPESTTEKPPRANPRRGVEQMKRAEAKVAQAKSVAAKAGQAREEAHASLQQADQSVADAGDRVARLRRDLHQAEKAQSKAETDRRRAQGAFDRADRGARLGQQQLTDAAAERERLEP
jgi:hypothetical protein